MFTLWPTSHNRWRNAAVFESISASHVFLQHFQFLFYLVEAAAAGFNSRELEILSYVEMNLKSGHNISARRIFKVCILKIA